ncbi:MAG: CoA-binding protein [Patescibacteria group bacterium]|jgi:succinyl-CoA synthetase alpha subunit
MNMKLFSPDALVAIQGITGKEGARMTEWLLGSGVQVVGGVTPGKGGQTVLEKPVFNSVAELRAMFPAVEASCVVVPPQRVLGAVIEAIEAGIRFVHILSENVPVHDALMIRDLAKKSGAMVLGPSSVGYLQFPPFRLGYLGGERPFDILHEGDIAVISTSGGMANELMMALGNAGIGIRVAMAIGGDRISGTALEEAIRWCESLPEVRRLALFVEPGQPWVLQLASGETTLQKPASILLAGDALDNLPRGLPYGHTGTILGEDDVSVRDLRSLLEARGIRVTGSVRDFVLSCTEV